MDKISEKNKINKVNKKIQILRSKFHKYNIDGYIVLRMMIFLPNILKLIV